MPALVDARGERPERVYATISTPEDVARLEQYVAAAKPGFKFTTFGKGTYGHKELKNDLGPINIKLMQSDGLGTLNQGPNEIVWRKVRTVLAVRVNKGTLVLE